MKANKATVRARVDDILRVILDGAEPFQIRQYVSEMEGKGEPPWTVPEGGKPLSERQIRRYCDRADDLLAEAQRTNRKRLIRRHVGKLRNLFARAVNKGDERTALAALAAETKLLRLDEDEVSRQIQELRRELEALKRAQDDSDRDPPGAGGPAPEPGAPSGDLQPAAAPAESGRSGSAGGGGIPAGPLAGGTSEGSTDPGATLCFPTKRQIADG
jgi:hypothetical protein